MVLERRRTASEPISNKTLYINKEDFNKAINNKVKRIPTLEIPNALNKEYKEYKDRISVLT